MFHAFRRSGSREARLLPEYAAVHPRLKADRWIRIRFVLQRLGTPTGVPSDRFSLGEQFEFRGGDGPRNPAWPLLRQRASDSIALGTR